MVSVLAPADVERLAAAPLTYAEVGATRSDEPVAGYHHLSRSRVLATRDLGRASAALMGWRLQERAGLRVAASTPEAGTGTVLEMRLGVGPLALRVPCRVVYVIEQEARVGFAYGTLPDDPALPPGVGRVGLRRLAHGPARTRRRTSSRSMS